MGVTGAEQPLCACQTECQEFQKIIDLKDTGLVVYCRTTRREDVISVGVTGSALSTSQDVFILHNTKDVKIRRADFVPALEKEDISCPRCRKLFEHAQELLQKVTSIDERNVMGVCDHCRIKAQSKKSCYECDETVKKFISSRGEQKEDTKSYIKIWLSKMKHLLRDAIISDKVKRVKTRAYSDIQIDRLCQYSPITIREPEVKQLIRSQTHKSDTNLYTDTNDAKLKKQDILQKSVVFAEYDSLNPFAVTPYGGGIISTMRQGPSFVASEATIGEPYEDKEPRKASIKVGSRDLREKQEHISEYDDDAPVDINGVMKRIHDVNLRRMMKEKEPEGPFSVTNYSETDVLTKIAPLKQKLHHEKQNDDFVADIKVETKIKNDMSLRHVTSPKSEIPNMYSVSHEDEKYGYQESRKKRDHVLEYYDDSIMDIKPTKKRKRDLSLKTLTTPESKSRDLHSKTPQKVLRETQREIDLISKSYSESLTDFKGNIKRKHDPNLKRMTGTEKETKKYKIEHKTKIDSGEMPKKLMKREHRYLSDEDIRFQRSIPKYSHDKEKPGEQVTKTSSKRKKDDDTKKPVKSLVKEQFSYFFPKVKAKEPKKPNIIVPSSQLLKTAKEKIRKQAEEETKKHEETRKKKLEDNERKKFTREEKKDKKHADDDKVISEEERRRRDEEKYKGGKTKIEKVDLSTLSGKADKTDKPYVDANKDSKIIEPKDKMDKETHKEKKELQSRTQPKHEVDKETQREKKELKSKTEPKDTTDKKTELLQKEKAERNELNKREQEENDRLKQITQLKKEKEAAKKHESSKGVEQPSKKKGSPKDKKTAKIEDLSKEEKEPEPIKRTQELAKQARQSAQNKEKKEPSAEKEETTKKKVTSKDLAQGTLEKPKEKVETSKVPGETKASKIGTDENEFRKLQAEHVKQKAEELKKKKQQEADKKVKEAAGLKLRSIKEAKAVPKSEPSRLPTEQSKEVEEEEVTMRELKFHEVKMRQPSPDDLILRLVRIRQTAIGEGYGNDPFNPAMIRAHKCHHIRGMGSSVCDLCIDSELEFDIESYEHKLNHIKSELAEIIIGENIFKYNPAVIEKSEKQEVIPILFKSVITEEPTPLLTEEFVTQVPEKTEREKKPIQATKDTKVVDQESAKGIIRYALSDRTFIDKGWTMLPTEKVVRKMNVYRMRPAHPEFDWFEHNKNKRLMTYDTGEKLAEFDDNGRGRWYYKNGRLALDYYNAEETNAQQRFVIYSSGEPDERGRSHPITILATFDYLGNGIVFDHAGKIRLKYNQTEGVVLDREIGPVSHWKWHTLNDPPVLQQVMIDTQMAHKDPEIIKLGSSADFKTRPDNEEMLAIEFDNFIKEKSKKLCQKFKPFQIKMKALKINEHFSLKVLDQATIYLIFRDGSTSLKLNIGMILDHQEIVDTDTAEVGEVSNNLERFPARTDSLAGLQRSVAYAQRYERQRTERERRLRRPQPSASADQLTAAASLPLRPPLRSIPTDSTSSAGYCKCRKPANNLYYNTRLL